MLPVLFAIPGLVFVIGLAALAAGLRGKRCNDHPICRKCKFDLFGNPTADTCPECGGELKRKRAVRIGERRKRRWLIAMAAMLLLLGTGGLGGSGYLATQDIDWQKHKPAWWLTFEAGLAPGETSNVALDELENRYANDKLSQGAIESIIDSALACQADTNRTWQPPWGRFVESQRSLGKLPDEKWQRYTAVAVKQCFLLQPRQRVLLGDPVPLRVAFRQEGVRRAESKTFDVEFAIESVTIAGRDYPVESFAFRSQRLVMGETSEGLLEATSNPPIAPPGKVPVTVTLSYLAELPYPEKEQATPPTNTITLLSTFRMLPADATSLVRISDPQQAPTMQYAVRCEHLSVVSFDAPRPNELVGVMTVANPPVHLAARVYARVDDRLLPAKRVHSPSRHGLENPLVAPARAHSVYQLTFPWPADLPPTTHVDLVCKPALEQAVRHVRYMDAWDAPITVERIPIRQSPW